VFDGSKKRPIGVVELNFKYNNKNYCEKFNILKNDGLETILLCNEFSKNAEIQELRKIPVECVIDTKDSAPTSWSRPIKNLKDKADFKILLKEYMEKGIVEKSVSSWCNPVVLIRKKTGNLRFCEDFRRLNDLVYG
jgi:hypothetical protein